MTLLKIRLESNEEENKKQTCNGEDQDGQQLVSEEANKTESSQCRNGGVREREGEGGKGREREEEGGRGIGKGREGEGEENQC